MSVSNIKAGYSYIVGESFRVNCRYLSHFCVKFINFLLKLECALKNIFKKHKEHTKPQMIYLNQFHFLLYSRIKKRYIVSLRLLFFSSLSIILYIAICSYRSVLNTSLLLSCLFSIVVQEISIFNSKK